MPVYNTIAFQNGQKIRITDECNHMVALDLISVLTNDDRKKASQTLARVSIRDDTSSLITLRRLPGKKNPRKLISFSNAIQLLLILPKRTVSLQTRRDVAGVLADFFEKSPRGADAENPPPSSNDTAVENVDMATQHAKLSLQHQAADLEGKHRKCSLRNSRHASH
jgi:hypothetical protein